VLQWIKRVFGRHGADAPVAPPDVTAPLQKAYTCGRQDHLQPRPSKVTFREAVDLVVREHGETLRELADR
jgi:hypothetical protein